MYVCIYTYIFPAAKSRELGETSYSERIRL